LLARSPGMPTKYLRRLGVGSPPPMVGLSRS
jgi:hypothetical protein